MDNVTHTIIGLAVGEVAVQWRASSKKGLETNLRPLYWLASAIGNNIPDIDVATTYFLFPGKLGYLLDHRGYTHTIGLLPIMTALTMLFCYLYARLRHVKPSAFD